MFAHLWARLAAWWEHRFTVNYLNHLDQRLLDDMGIKRNEIEARLTGKPVRLRPVAPCLKADGRLITRTDRPVRTS